MPDQPVSLTSMAVNNVLCSLGDEMVGVMKYNLSRFYAIELENSTVDELQFGLAKLLGENAAEVIIKQINEEIVRLSEAQVS